MARTSYALNTFGSSTAGMLTATPGWSRSASESGRPTAPRRTLRQWPTGAPLSSEPAAPGLCGMRSRAARGEGRCRSRPCARHSAREAEETRAERGRCQPTASQFASIFCQFSLLFVETRPFSSDRVRGGGWRGRRPGDRAATSLALVRSEDPQLAVFWLETCIFRTFDGRAVVHRL